MKKHLGKIVLAAMALCMVFSMDVAAASKKKGPVVGYIAKNTVDAFHATLNKAAKESLDKLKKNGTIADWHLYDGLTDPVTQCNLLEDALNMGCNIIIVLPAEAAGCSPILERCKAKNVPCIVVNSKTNNTDALATAYVGSDDVQAGEMMAKFVQSKVPAGGGYGHVQGYYRQLCTDSARTGSPQCIR